MLSKAFLGALFLSAFFVYPVLSEEAPQLAGVGGVFASSPYRGVGTRSMAVPVVRLEHKNFYLRGVEAGYHFYKTDQLTLSALVAPRFMGYHSSESSDLQGMEDRDMSVDAGLKVDVALPWEGASVTGKLVNDVGSVHHGQVFDLSISRKFKGSIWRFIPSVGTRFQSAKLVDYYYGVRDNETTANRSQYEPDGAINYFADALFTCGISKNWVVVTQFGLESLSDEIRKSPIVDRSVLWTGIIGVARRF